MITFQVSSEPVSLGCNLPEDSFFLPKFAAVQSLSCVSLLATPWTVATRLLCPWDSPGKNTRVDCHFLLQEIFPTQGLNPASLVSPALQAGSLPLAPSGNL